MVSRHRQWLRLLLRSYDGYVYVGMVLRHIQQGYDCPILHVVSRLLATNTHQQSPGAEACSFRSLHLDVGTWSSMLGLLR